MTKIQYLIILGLITRIFLVIWSFQFPQNPDLLRHRDWGRIAYLHSLKDTYDPNYLSYGKVPNNLPPGSLYIISGMYNAQIQVSKLFLKLFNAKEGSINWINIYLVDFFLKLPSIVADLLIAFLIYKIIRESRKDRR